MLEIQCTAHYNTDLDFTRSYCVHGSQLFYRSNFTKVIGKSHKMVIFLSFFCKIFPLELYSLITIL